MRPGFAAGACPLALALMPRVSCDFGRALLIDAEMRLELMGLRHRYVDEDSRARKYNLTDAGKAQLERLATFTQRFRA